MIIILSREKNRQKWSDIIDRQISSSQTQAVWCQENDVNIHNFRYWRRRLQEAPLDDSKISFVTIKPKEVAIEKSITLRIGAAILDITGDVDSGALDSVVQVLMRYA